jgi:hypothetical protein
MQFAPFGFCNRLCGPTVHALAFAFASLEALSMTGMSIQAHCNVLQKSLSALQTGHTFQTVRPWQDWPRSYLWMLLWTLFFFTAGRPCPQVPKSTLLQFLHDRLNVL